MRIDGWTLFVMTEKTAGSSEDESDDNKFSQVGIHSQVGAEATHMEGNGGALGIDRVLDRINVACWKKK